MYKKETKFSFTNKMSLWVAGVLVVLFLAVALF